MATDLETPASGPPPSAGSRGSVTPGWLAEVLEVLVLRRTVLVATALGLSLLGVLTAMVVPQILPPRPLVGAAVGLAAVLLAVAAALGIDSVDLTIRGPRHVRSSGGRLGAEVAGPPDVRSVAGLAAAVARRAAAGRGRVGLVAAAEDGPDPRGWADAVARALSARGLRVLLVDLVAGRSDGPGVGEVAAGEARIAQAVGFDHELLLATLGPGRDRHAALAGLPAVVERLPSDIEVLLVALPHLSEPGALGAAGSLDRLVVLVEEDRTARVDLIAALDAIDETEAASEALLLREAAPPLAAEADAPAPVAEPVELDHPTGPIPPVVTEPADTDAQPSHPADVEAPEEDVADTPGQVSDSGAPGDEPAAALVADRPASHDAEEGPPDVEPVAVADGGDGDEVRDEPSTDGGILADLTVEPAPTVVAAPPLVHAAPVDPAPAGEDTSDAPQGPDPAGPGAEGPLPDPFAERESGTEEPSTVHEVGPPSDDDPLGGRDRWAQPARHEELVGSHLAVSPFPEHEDLPEDPVRLAAALQTLASEVWRREEEAGPETSDDRR